MALRRRTSLVLLPLFCMLGCARTPIHGSVGMPHRGVLTSSAQLPAVGAGYRWLRQDDRHHAVPRLVQAIARAAATVARERPGGVLSVGDLSVRGGGRLMPHFSHRSGRDADLLLYLTTLDGAPVESPGFIAVGRDGLAWDAGGKRWLRFDVERTWLLVKALVEDPEARIQWVFAHHDVEALVIDWARARHDAPETILRAMEVMLQPSGGGGLHDDHVHIRTACTPDEIIAGCEPTGPSRAWIDALDGARMSEAELVAEVAKSP